MHRFTRYLFLDVLGFGVFSIVVTGLIDILGEQVLKGIAFVCLGVAISVVAVRFDRDHLRAR